VGFVDGGDEAVAAAGDCFDVTGLIGGVAEGGAEAIDGGAEAVVELDKGVVAPDALAQLVARDDLAGVFEEGEQDFEGLILQLDAHTVFSKFGVLLIDLKSGEAKDGLGGVVRQAGSEFDVSVSISPD